MAFIRTRATGISAVVLRREGRLVTFTAAQLINGEGVPAPAAETKPKKTKRKGRKR